MKLSHILLAALCLAGAGAKAQTDVTSTYFTNPSFETNAVGEITSASGVTGWTVATASQFYNNKVLDQNTSSGADAMDGKNAAPSDGTKYYYTRHSWNDRAWDISTTSTTELPAGKYYAVIDYKAQHTGGSGQTLHIAINAHGGGQLAASPAKELFYAGADNKNSYLADADWAPLGVVFDLAAATQIDVVVSAAVKNCKRNDMCYDNLRLYSLADVSETATADLTGLVPNAKMEAGAQVWTGEMGTHSPNIGAVASGMYELEKWASGALGNFDANQTLTGLPNGRYTVRAGINATKQSSTGDAKKTDVTGVTFYAGSDNNSDVRTLDGTGEVFEVSTIVPDHSLTIGLKTESTTANWVVWDNVQLIYRGPDPTIAKNELADLLVTAEAMNVAPISSSDAAALTAAITAAQALDPNTASTADYTSAITTISGLVNAVSAWRSSYAAAKDPLVAVLDRFAADYATQSGAPKQGMSDGAWSTLLDAVNAATAAKDVTDSYDGFAPAATTFTAALDAADVSINLYKNCAALREGLPNVQADILAGVQFPATYADDAAVQAAIDAMDAAARTYYNSRIGQTTDVSALLGENLDFETTPTTADSQFPNVYEIPGWDNSFSSAADANNLKWAYREQKTKATMEDKGLASGVTTANALYMRSNWSTTTAKMHITKQTLLPSGQYVLTFFAMRDQTGGTAHNYYMLGDERHDIAVGTTWEKKELAISLTEPTAFTLSFGFETPQGNNASDIYVDDISLTVPSKSPYRTALETLQARSDAGTGAVKGALDQFTYTAAEEATKTTEEIDLAMQVFKNATAIADASGDATAMWKNTDFTGGTDSHATQGGNGQLLSPKEWTLDAQVSGWNDSHIKEENGVKAYNFWAENITRGEITQKAVNLPNGTYRITADICTKVSGGDSWVALYGAPDQGNVGRAENAVCTGSESYEPYSVDVTVGHNALTIGLRTDHRYFKVKNVQVAYVADDAAKTDAGTLLQDAFLHRSDLVVDLSSHTAAQRVKVYVDEKNALILAAAGAVANTANVIAAGQCANLTLADGSEFDNGTTAFTAAAATYVRTLKTDGSWATICLPFAADIPADVTVYAFASDHTDYITVDAVTSMEAGRAYLMKYTGTSAEETADVTFRATNAAIAAHTAPTADGMFGDTRKYTVTAGTTVYMLSAADHKLHQATAGSWSAPFRAIYAVPAGAAVKQIRVLDDEATGIRALGVDDPSQPVNVYSVSGQAVRLATPAGQALRGLAKGVYVVNNKKVIIK